MDFISAKFKIFNFSSAIPTQGNRAELVLTCLHHNNFGIDEFLGQVTLPLNQFDQFERPRSRWYKMLAKPGHDKKDKDRGELEIRTAFTVKAGSLSDLSKKEKNKSSSNNIAGSLLSLGTLEKRKTLKKFAKSLGSKMHVTGKKKKEKSDDSDSYSGSFSSLGTPNMGLKNSRNMTNIGNADPGVISEDEDEFAFDNLSHKSSGSSLNQRPKTNNLILTGNEELSPSKTSATLPPLKPPRNPNDTPTKDGAKVNEWEAKLYGKSLDLGHGHSTDSLKRRSWESSRVPLNLEDNVKEREATIEEQSMDRISLSSNSPTAPATPTAAKRQQNELVQPKPRTLPRSNTSAEPIVNLDVDDSSKLSPISLKTEKPEKQEKPDNMFAKRWKNFKREITPTKQDEQIRNQYNKTSTTGNGGERIIIGGENMFNNSYVEKKVEVSKEILVKYDGKSKEVSWKLKFLKNFELFHFYFQEIMKIAHNLENDLVQQKQKNKELEEYLDVLLLRVMETHPRILQNPFQTKSHLKQR